jgi:hypothetical protein
MRLCIFRKSCGVKGENDSSLGYSNENNQGMMMRRVLTLYQEAYTFPLQIYLMRLFSERSKTSNKKDLNEN